MFHRISIFAWLLAPLALLPVLPRFGGYDGVRDDASFFSPAAVRDASAVIDRIRDDHKRDVLVETIPEVPQDLRDDLQQKGKAKFFADWAAARAKEHGISGVYILICKNPSHLQVAVGNVTQQELFTVADRDELARKLLARFRTKQFDQGLLDGVQFIQRQMDAHAPPVGEPPSAATAPTISPAGPSPSLPTPLHLSNTLSSSSGDSQ
jgi:uncharacterized membrane protein YgcG